MGLLRTIVFGRENGIRASLRRALQPDRDEGKPAAEGPRQAGRDGPAGGEPPPPKPAAPIPTDAPEGFVRACALAEVPVGGVREVIVDGRPVAVARPARHEVHAVHGTCPHADGPLGEGALDGHKLVCPFHGWVFDVTTGRCETDTAASIRTYAVAVRDDTVYVRV